MTNLDTHFLTLFLANLDTHILIFFLGTFHEFTVRGIERGEPWHCHAASTSKKGKKAFIIASADVYGGHFYVDSTLLQTGTFLTAKHGW